MNTAVLIRWAPTSLVSIIVSPIALISSFTSIRAAGGKVVGGESLVSHGTDTAGQNECYGTYDSTGAYGPAYQYACIHSGTNSGLTTDNVWYNYVTASAGTIVDKNTDSEHPANNTYTATESVCPSGWTLPTTKQIDANRDISGFSPVLGGGYGSGTPHDETTRGYWWGSEAYSNAARYGLGYRTDDLYTRNGYRHYGYSIRCVSEEKAITSLTYMQDMTPAIVAPPC